MFKVRTDSKMKCLFIILCSILVIKSSCGEFYRSTDTINGVLKGTVVLQSKMHSLVSCINACAIEKATGVFNNGLCTCVAENELGDQFISTQTCWKKDNDVSTINTSLAVSL